VQELRAREIRRAADELRYGAERLNDAGDAEGSRALEVCARHLDATARKILVAGA
jgi:hypothetical protein